MMQNRRQFVGHLVTGAATVAILGAEGCTIGSALAQLEKWMPVGLQAFAGVVAIIGVACAACGVAVLAAKAAWADVSAAIAAYNAAPSANKTTLLGKVETAIGALITSLPDIFKQLGGLPFSGTVTAALELIMATLSAIDANLGGTPPVAAPKAVKAAVSGKDFKKQFNQIVSAGGFPQYAI